METNSKALTEQLQSLGGLSNEALQTEWRRLCRSQPPRVSRDLLVRALAYRIQEIAKGGLSKATERRLAALGKSIASSGDLQIEASGQIRPGARLVREWRGATHVVVVRENGFEWQGRIHGSLSRIAQAITGAHWSGPRFFALVRRERARQVRQPGPAQIMRGGEGAHA